MTEPNAVTRRGFLETAGLATGAVMASGTFAHPAIGAVKGANERINFAILGPGGRAQEHIKHLTRLKEQGANVDIIGLADVWDGNKEVGRGLYPSAEKCKLDVNDKSKITKDYRKLLESKDVDGVLVATPDHWHAKMCVDAMDAGKDVYCEKPMTHTIEEARKVAETVKRTGQVFTVGVQSTTDPRWKMANEMITAGKIGHVMQGTTSYYRNSEVGQWRYYPLTADMNPKTVDWKMFLGTEFGLAPDMPFNRAKYAQWRCYWDFGGGMYTDLFVHQLTHLIQAMGVRFPARVVGAGGLYLENDGRDVPDMATVVADYDEGCQVLVTATMCNDTQIGEMIRGHLGTIKFDGRNDDGFLVAGQKFSGKPAPPGSNNGEGGERFKPKQPVDDTRALWTHFIECCRSRNQETMCPAELGYAAIATVNLGVKSYREGKAYYFDKETGQITDADTSWAKKWEKVSADRGKSKQVIGWHAENTGSFLEPPDYQKLEGDWVGGNEPAMKS